MTATVAQGVTDARWAVWVIAAALTALAIAVARWSR